MKKQIILFLTFATLTMAHDHIEVGEDMYDPTRLGMDGPGYQLALYVPPGEPFSGYIPNFPGGWFANELTFTTEASSLAPAIGAEPHLAFISISGPSGGAFYFWEVGAIEPTWGRAAGWTNSPDDSPSIPVVYGGDHHVHGRAFTMNKPGEYSVSFRAVDASGHYSSSTVKTMTFVAQPPPPMTMKITNGMITLSFTSRINLDYDVQSCANLMGGGWQSEAVIFGDGAGKNHSQSISGNSLMFFRLIEY
ncbi:MAG TPA: hypothetical protein PJ991_02665 [Kiritimatiellia bacterium]|nr:hypothetical protein [Kiritimatiellia bacterium]